jgi:D-alanine--poly(phosphoribitol) ligase subunit 2
LPRKAAGVSDRSTASYETTGGTEMSIEKQVLLTLAEVAEIEEINLDLGTRLFETHILNSLKTVEFVLLLSDRLGVDISPAEIDREHWATPGLIIQYLEGRKPS